MREPLVILGVGLAGAKAAETLREEGFDGRLLLVGEALHRPNEPPLVSKDHIHGDAEREAIYVHPEALNTRHKSEQRIGRRGLGLDAGARELVLDVAALGPVASADPLPS